MCHRCILRLRCVLQVLTSPVPPGIAKACTLGQDRAHAAQREAVCGVSTKKLAQHGPSTGVSAKALAQRTAVCGSSAKKLAQRTKKGPKTALYGVLGELFRACTHTRPSRANFFAPKLLDARRDETVNTNARTSVRLRETRDAFARQDSAENVCFCLAMVPSVSPKTERAPAKVMMVWRKKASAHTNSKSRLHSLSQVQRLTIRFGSRRQITRH